MHSEIKPYGFQCPIAGKYVVVTRETIRGLSGVGDDCSGIQHAYSCADDESCPHRYTPNCRVQVLNGEAL